ncbi:ABC transporter permease [Levilactobacillus hammesii]|uniref:Export protein n=1 Tax=Levilactobacillus hammesii DSM 16381 TaxID=1423753 RepID=A0A0R1UML8_9LACO|nr:permease [Levilactobacillus hammesii]KRL94429.1 export protein [Levilactobacillus hammesii DSM 16381]
MTSRFARTGRLTGLALRRDRLRILIWVLILAGLMVGVAFKFTDIFGTPHEIAAIKGTLKSPAMVALLGAFKFTNNPSTAQIFSTEMVVFMAITQIVMNIMLGVHATRGEEDQGITELVRSRAVGQLAPLTAAALELVIINSFIAILYGVGLGFSNMHGITTEGNWAVAIGLAATSLGFGILGLVTAQLADHSASATGLAYGLFGLAYVVRMMTDVQNPDYTWWSPLGWVEKISPYYHPNWLPIFLSLATALILYLLAATINLHRDLNAGALATRPGRRTASSFLRGPASLLWRREHNVIIGWIIGLAILAMTYGSIYNSIGDMLKTNPTMQQVFGSNVIHEANHAMLVSFTSTLVILMAALATIPGMQLIYKLYSDETNGWLESLYARPLSRTRLFFSYLCTGLLSSIVAFGVAVSSLILVGNATLSHPKDGLTRFEFWQAIWGQLPAILVFLGIATALIGWWPRLRTLNWLYLGIGFITIYMGGMLKLPKWLQRLAPLGWMNKVPSHNVEWSTFSWMIVLSIIFIFIGWWGYRQRDLHMS